jgi:hypothetical protein
MTAAPLARITGSLAALMLATAAPAQQTPPAPSSADIVVNARKAAPAEVHKQAIAITKMDDDPYRMPLAQYQDPVCPGVMGMTRDNAVLMIDRIRFDAGRVGVRVAKDGCSPNLLVIFTRDGRATMQDLAHRRPYLFDQLNATEIGALTAEPGPVRSWTNTSIRTRDGMAMAGGGMVNTKPVLQMWAAHSKIYLTNRLDIETAVVMIDLAAIDGKPVVQIADYVAMRGLARTKAAGGDNALGTILSLFTPGAQPPYEMTPFDIAYLQSVYASLPNLPALTKLGAVPEAVRRNAKAEGK